MTNILSKKAVLANLSISTWGVRRFDKEAANEVLDKRGAEHHTGLFTKRLLNKKAMEDIRSVKSAIRNYHNFRTQPWLEDGTRILPTALYLDYAKQMQTYKEEFAQAVAVFVKEYPSYIKQAQKELGSLFNANDYPGQAMVKKRFAFEVVILPCPDTADFRVTMDAGEMATIKADLEARLTAQITVALKDVGERLSSVVGHMAKRLKAYKPADSKKGKKAEGTFRDSLVENVKELAELLPAFNLNGDSKLEAIYKRVLKELCKCDADSLREDDNLRKSVAKAADEILKDVSAFLA